MWFEWGYDHILKETINNKKKKRPNTIIISFLMNMT